MNPLTQIRRCTLVPSWGLSSAQCRMSNENSPCCVRDVFFSCSHVASLCLSHSSFSFPLSPSRFCSRSLPSSSSFCHMCNAGASLPLAVLFVALVATPFEPPSKATHYPATACPRTRPGVAVSSRAASARASLAIVGPRVVKRGGFRRRRRVDVRARFTQAGRPSRDRKCTTAFSRVPTVRIQGIHGVRWSTIDNRWVSRSRSSSKSDGDRRVWNLRVRGSWCSRIKCLRWLSKIRWSRESFILVRSPELHELLTTKYRSLGVSDRRCERRIIAESSWRTYLHVYGEYNDVDDEYNDSWGDW